MKAMYMKIQMGAGTLLGLGKRPLHKECPSHSEFNSNRIFYVLFNIQAVAWLLLDAFSHCI